MIFCPEPCSGTCTERKQRELEGNLRDLMGFIPRILMTIEILLNFTCLVPGSEMICKL
jgi:hypothetical protein